MYNKNSPSLMIMQKQIDKLNNELKTLRKELDEMHTFVDNVLDDIHIPDFKVASSVTLKDKVIELEERIDSCPISDVANRLVCPKCGSRGIVKVPIICSECDLHVNVGF